MTKHIGVFMGGSAGNQPIFKQIAEILGEFIAKCGDTLVYGGGDIGLMGAVADSALKNGGEVIGVSTPDLSEREGHKALSRMHIFPTLQERKACMFNLSDGFIILPGGMGTLDELTDLWTSIQINQLNKPFVLLNVDGYFDGLLIFLREMVEKGFFKQDEFERIIITDSPIEALEELFQALDKLQG